MHHTSYEFTVSSHLAIDGEAKAVNPKSQALSTSALGITGMHDFIENENGSSNKVNQFDVLRDVKRL